MVLLIFIRIFCNYLLELLLELKYYYIIFQILFISLEFIIIRNYIIIRNIKVKVLSYEQVEYCY